MGMVDIVPPDPVALLAETTNAEIAEWITAIEPVLHLKVLSDVGRPGRLSSRLPLYTEWQINFFLSVKEQFERRIGDGFDHQPLTGKQLMQLHRMYRQAADHAARTLEGIGNE